MSDFGEDICFTCGHKQINHDDIVNDEDGSESCEGECLMADCDCPYFANTEMQAKA